MRKFNFDSTSLDTFVLIADDKLYTKSTAALRVSKELKSPLRIIYPLIIFPKFIRDSIYDLIAKHRYKIFGKRKYVIFHQAISTNFLNKKQFLLLTGNEISTVQEPDEAEEKIKIQ